MWTRTLAACFLSLVLIMAHARLLKKIDSWARAK